MESEPAGRGHRLESDWGEKSSRGRDPRSPFIGRYPAG